MKFNVATLIIVIVVSVVVISLFENWILERNWNKELKYLSLWSKVWRIKRMSKISKILALIGLICLALSFGNTGEWFRIILIICDGVILATSD